MRRTWFVLMVGLLVFVPASRTAGTAPQRAASGNKGLVVSGRAAATNAGIQMLEHGGNAADAGAATLLALSVTYVGAFCIGGEVPVLIYDAARKDVKVLAGQGAAPLDPKAIDWYMTNGIPGTDVRSAAVPAALDLIVTLLKLYGTRSFEEAVQPTLAILDAGGASWYIDTSDGRKIETGKNWQAELAVTFRKLVEAERKAGGSRNDRLQAVADRFYRGDIADALERWYIAQGGFLRKADLAAHRTRVEDPVYANYRGYTVYKCGPWTQGPYLLETLRLLEGFDIRKMGFLSADYIHLVSEAMKLSLADRDEYYGDPRFVDVPMKALLSDEYTRIRRPLIDMSKASLDVRPGDPIHLRPLKTPLPARPGQGGTTTMCVADRWGNVIAATPSGLGSTAGVAGDTGIIHGSRLVSLNTWKRHPDCIQPGKRPRVTLSPTLVLKDGKPVLAISVAGGDLQDQAAIQLILDYLEFGMLPEQAVSEPRFATFHHTGSFGQDKPRLGSLQVNVLVDEAVQGELKKRGHALTTTRGGIGGVNMLFLDPKSDLAYGAGPAAGKASQ
ncbi:MAG TPA: gamma-glutamyltransferase [Terriglobales bacterium]|nr:gamma-glutamyltransferase [Terriglobales bacterium]